MSKPNYRVNVTFDGERKLFMARAPELEHCTAEGATRAEAMTRLEEEIDAQLANMLSQGSTPPRSVDEETFSGEVSGKISKGLHREITYQARAEGVEVELLVAELLAAAMESRKQTRGPRGGNRAPVDHDNIGNRADGNRGDGNRGDGNRGGRGFGRGQNNAMLDDRATFIEYVRGLEQQGGHAGHNRHPGGGGPHGGGGDRRRRGGRGGRGGGGGNPNYRGGGGHNERHFGGNGNGGGNYGNGNHGNAPRNPAPSAPSNEAPPPQGAGPAGDDSGEV